MTPTAFTLVILAALIHASWNIVAKKASGGALFVALWWYGALALLPVIIARLANYDLTYGSLAGVIISLIFFWFVGFGFTIGAHLNAALSEPPEPALKAAAKE